MAGGIISNLKVKFSSDTKQLKKGMDDGTKSLNDFKKQGTGAISELSAAIGVDLNRISSGFSGFNSTLSNLGKGFSGAAAGSNGLAAAMKILKVALISTGIGALVVALGSLVAYFMSTNAGADKFSKIMAGIGAFVRVLSDKFADLGEAIVYAFTNPKEAVAKLWEAIKTNVVNRFKGIGDLFANVGKAMKALFTADWDGLKAAAGDVAVSVTQIYTGLDETQQKSFVTGLKNLGAEMANAATQAANLDERLDNLQDAQRALDVLESERIKKIKALRLIADDEKKSIEERMAASKQAMQIELQNLADRKKLATELVAINQGKVDLRNGKAMDDQLDELAESQKALNALESESLTLQKKLQAEYQNLATAMVKSRQESDNYLIKAREINTELNKKINFGSLDPSKLKPYVESMVVMAEEAKSVIIDLSGVVNEALTNLASGFGESLGMMMAGTGSISDFSSMILGVLGDMLIKLGNIALAAGFGLKAIQAAFESFQPGVAIAAGIALIALGTAIKSSVKGLSSGGGGGLSMSSPTTSYDTRTRSSAVGLSAASEAIKIEGEFKLKGSTLVAAVNKETNRKNLST